MRHPSSADRSDDPARLFVAGDCALDDDRVPVTDELRRRIDGADLSVVNLEAPVAPVDEPIPKAGPVKRSVEGTPAVLRDSGFDAVTLANNHTMDYGESGLRGTLRACDEAGLWTAGAGPTMERAMEPIRATLDGVSVAVFSFCEREFGVTTGDEPGTAWISQPAARRRVVEAADEVDVVVVAAHGGVEYVPFPPPRRQRQLRGFVEAGADVVVGHHPHVPQGWEMYRGAPIFYSLGNLRYEHVGRPKTNWGLALELTFEPDSSVSVELVPTARADGTQRADESEVADGLIHELDREAATDELQYLYRITEITARPDRLQPYWQEVAVQLFFQRYHRWLRQATGARIRDQLRWPGQHLSREALWAEDRRGPMLVLLNLLRNESHRAVIETALSLKVGEGEDLRTDEVYEEVRDLMEWTEDRPLYDRPSPVRTTVRGVADRLNSMLSVPRAALSPASDNENA